MDVFVFILTHSSLKFVRLNPAWNINTVFNVTTRSVAQSVHSITDIIDLDFSVNAGPQPRLIASYLFVAWLASVRGDTYIAPK